MKNTGLHGFSKRDTLNAKRKKAETLRKLGRKEEAFCLMQELVEQWSKKNGSSSIETINCQEGMAQTLFDLRRYEEALDIFIEVYIQRKRMVECDEVQTTTTLCRITTTYKILGF